MDSILNSKIRDIYSIGPPGTLVCHDGFAEHVSNTGYKFLYKVNKIYICEDMYYIVTHLKYGSCTGSSIDCYFIKHCGKTLVYTYISWGFNQLDISLYITTHDCDFVTDSLEISASVYNLAFNPNVSNNYGWEEIKDYQNKYVKDFFKINRTKSAKMSFLAGPCVSETV